MIKMKLLCNIMESTVDRYEKRNTIYIYIYNTAVLIKICRFLINVAKFIIIKLLCYVCMYIYIFFDWA